MVFGEAGLMRRTLIEKASLSGVVFELVAKVIPRSARDAGDGFNADGKRTAREERKIVALEHVEVLTRDSEEVGDLLDGHIF